MLRTTDDSKGEGPSGVPSEGSSLSGFRPHVAVLEVLFALWAAFVLVVGGSVYNSHSFMQLIDQPVASVLAAMVTFALAIGFCVLVQYLAYRSPAPQQVPRHARPAVSTRKQCLITALVLAAVYLPCWLAFFPGVLAYDMELQLHIICGVDPWSNWVPVLHTLLLDACIQLGQMLGGGNWWLALYSLLSIAATVATYTYLTHWIITRGYGRRAAAITTAVFALDPIFALMSFNPTRDVMFGCSFLLFVLAVLDVHRGYDRGAGILGGCGKPMASAVAFGLIASLSRNNAPYSLLIAAICLLVSALVAQVWHEPALRNARRVTALTVAAPALVVVAMMQLLYPAIGVKGTPIGDPLSFAINQMAGTINAEDDSDPALREARAYFPAEIPFNPRFADPAKHSFDADLAQADLGKFADTYLAVVRTYPGDCLALGLDLNVDYWYPFAQTPDPVSGVSFIEVATYNDAKIPYPVTRTGWLPGLHDWYAGVARHEADFMNLPVLQFLFNLALPSTVMVPLAYVAARLRRRPLALCVLLAFSYFVLYLWSPVSNFRYVFPLFQLIPLMFVLVKRPAPQLKTGAPAR